MSVEGIESASRLRRGVTVWFAVFGGIAAWTAHLLILVSLVKYTCNVGGDVWVMHLTTAATSAVTLFAMGLSWRLLRSAGDVDEAADTAAGQLRFLGTAGLLLGAINLALILLEGSYAVVLHPCGG